MSEGPDYTLVYAKHPGIEGVGQMPRAALDGTDWTEVDTVAATATAPDDLSGSALSDALDAAGLSKSGSADEKRQRLAEYQASLPA